MSTQINKGNHSVTLIYLIAWQLLLLSVVFIRNCQLCATLCATCCQYATAVLCGHSLTETMLVLSLSVRGLECSFHCLIFFICFSVKKYFTSFSLQNYSFFLYWQRFWLVIFLILSFGPLFTIGKLYKTVVRRWLL